MNCKNCGARLRDNARVCPNCGAFVDDESGFTLLTSDDRLDDFYSSDEPIRGREKTKKSGALSFIISLILVLAIAGGGAYYYFTHIKPKAPEAPSVSFTAGSGVINGDEKVVFVSIEKNPKIQYIHGASVYSTEEGKSKLLLSSDYEYTKNIDDTFRAIFFDTKEFGLDKKANYKYTFEIMLSFIGSDDVFTYSVPINFSGKIKGDASDTVFDHSHSKIEGEATSAQAESDGADSTTADNTTKAPENDSSFAYESYWFTEPLTDGDTRTIFALKFNKDKTFVSTRYEKKGSANWAVSTYNGTLEEKDGYIIVTDSEGGEKSYYKIGDGELSEEKDGETVQKLTARKYNSVKNVEDFFGL